jgi:hypothetical protein
MPPKAAARALTNQRNITHRWIAVGLTSGIVVNPAAWFFWPRLSPIAEPIDRLLLAVQCFAGIGKETLKIANSQNRSANGW